MSSDRPVAPYFSNGEPQGFFCKFPTGRIRDVSVNDLTNRVFFVNDIHSVIYVCDMKQQNLLFSISRHVTYPMNIYAKGAIVILFNYNSMSLTFYSLEGDFISAYKMTYYIFGLTMDYRGGLNMCSWTPDCLIEMEDSEINRFGHGWLKCPNTIVSSGECLYVLDNSEFCCNVLRDKVLIKSIIARFPQICRQVTVPSGLSIDWNGNIIISDPGDGSIVVFNQMGTLLCKINSIGSCGSPILKSVTGIDLSAGGNLYVACRLGENLAFVL